MAGRFTVAQVECNGRDASEEAAGAVGINPQKERQRIKRAATLVPTVASSWSLDQ